VKNVVAWACRIAIAAGAAFVILRLAPVIRTEWLDGNGCPNIGPVPACYLVAVCYALMGVAAIFNPLSLQIVFWIGWVPVFLLALSGTVLEISGTPTCPAAPNGTPMCFYSLALAIVLAVLYVIAWWIVKASHSEITPAST